MFRTHRLELILALCALACIPALYFLGRFVKERIAPHESHPLAGYSEQDPCPGDSGETSSCWTAYYTAFLARYPSADALADLKARYNAGGNAKTFCHPLLHLIGAKAGKEYGSVAEAYKHADPFCRAGYYHGVLEGIFGDAQGGGEKLLSQLDSICADVPGKSRYSYEYFSCVHGIGHGLMAYFDHDLFKSLDGCTKLSPAWEQSTCSGGVFMENVISDSPEEPSRFLKSDDPLYPCDAVDAAFRGQCYLMQTSHILVMYDGDFAKTFSVCRSVEAAYRDICFQSLGRDASGYSYSDAASAAVLCAKGANLGERSNCLIGAAVDYIQSASPDSARALCVLGEEGARVPCVQAVEAQLRAL